MKPKKLIMSVTILCLMLALSNVAYAAPVYIISFAAFPAYPYNTAAYMNGAGDYAGCGPTTGAMILGYFEHYFGATGLLTPPTPSTVDEGEATAWVLHSASYMKTHGHEDPPNNGYGSVYDIKPGLENYAADRGYEVKVMAHAATSADPVTSSYNAYGAYGDAWTNDGTFWVDLGGGSWTIDPDEFCDWAEPKLTAGIAIFLTIDTVGNLDIYGDHWVPCVGVDKATHVYYWYDTYHTPLQSATICHCTEGIYGINFVRTVEYIGAIAGQAPVASFTEDAESGPVGTTINFDPSGSYDLDGTIVLYEWDFDGDGIYDQSSVTPDMVSHTYMVAGTFTVTLRVTDNDDLTGTATSTKYIGVSPVIPEVPLGTIVASALMATALAGYIAVPRWRRKQQQVNQ